MGSQQSNDNFNEKMDMNEHRNKMATMNNQYRSHDLDFRQGATTQVKNEQLTKMTRKNVLYKPSLNIITTQNQLKLSANYDCEQNCVLEIYIDVIKVIEDNVSGLTTQIDSREFYCKELSPGSKQTLKAEFTMPKQSDPRNCTIILRMVNASNNEKTEYSLRRQNKKDQYWKILLQKFESNGVSYVLQNIYKGGEDSQQCIVCMCAQSDTLVKPCNHLCLCESCSLEVKKGRLNCPICRKTIKSFTTIGGI